MNETIQTIGKIYARMADAMSEIQAVGKDSKNQAQGFYFRGIDAVMNELHGILSKNRIFILQKLLDATHETKTTAKGGIMTHHFNRIEYQFTTDDGSHVDVTVIGESADSGDKGANKCMAVALKYALTQVFCIPTEDQGEPKDPDAQSHEFRAQRNEEQKLNDDAAGVETLPVSWRETVIHFGKNKGVKLGSLEANSLKWYQENWQPKEYKGKLSEVDRALRSALDRSTQPVGEGVQDHPPETTDWKNVVVNIDGEFNGKKLGELTDQQRMDVYNIFKPSTNTSTKAEDLYLKTALLAYKQSLLAS